MKHGFVTAMEDILDADKKTTHEKLATQVSHSHDTQNLHYIPFSLIFDRITLVLVID